MRKIGLLIALFAGLVFVLPTLTAQDAKKDAEKKAKKDEAKDADTKDEDKKKPEPTVKEKKAIEKMPAHGAKIRTKILSANGASAREFTIELQEIDPQKVQALNVWKIQQTQSLANQQLQAARQTSPQSRFNSLQSYQRAVFNYNIELAKRSANIYTPKPLEVRAHDDAKVRTNFLPVQFDDQGFQKKWTAKEIKEFQGETKLPGFPSDFDAIKSGQFVELYMVKQKAPTRDQAKKKKGPDDDPVEMRTTPEFILILILQEGK